jgi:hypothetical protein
MPHNTKSRALTLLVLGLVSKTETAYFGFGLPWDLASKIGTRDK